MSDCTEILSVVLSAETYTPSRFWGAGNNGPNAMLLQLAQQFFRLPSFHLGIATSIRRLAAATGAVTDAISATLALVHFTLCFMSFLSLSVV